MKVLTVFLAFCLAAICLSATFKEAYSTCLNSPPSNIWLELDKYLKNGLPRDRIQDVLEDYLNVDASLKKAIREVESDELDLDVIKGQLENAIGTRRTLNRITVPAEVYEDERAIQANFSYLEIEHDEIEERVKRLQRTLIQSQQRLYLDQNIVYGLFAHINRQICYISALSGLKLENFPSFYPEEDGLVIGLPHQIPISEPDFEFEAELREANYLLEAAKLEVVPQYVRTFVDLQTNFMLVCKIYSHTSFGKSSHATLYNWEEWTEVIYEGFDLEKYTSGYTKKGWRILSERGKRQLRRIVRHQFLTAHQLGIYRLAVDMSYFAINLVDPTTVIEIYKLYSYLMAQTGFKFVHFCLPANSILLRYYKHMQKYFERQTIRDDLEWSLKMKLVATEQQIPVWKVPYFEAEDDDDEILEDLIKEDDDKIIDEDDIYENDS